MIGLSFPRSGGDQESLPLPILGVSRGASTADELRRAEFILAQHDSPPC